MDDAEVKAKILELLGFRESEWLEFKQNNENPEKIGEYLSALSNSALLHDLPEGYLIFGIDDTAREIVGTSFKPYQTKKGNEELQSWLARLLAPHTDFKIYETVFGDMAVVLFVVDAAVRQPVKFNGTAYVRVGSTKKKLTEHPEKESKIWTKASQLSFENGFATDTLAVTDVLDLIDVGGYFRLMSLPQPETVEAMLERLQQDKLLVKDGRLYRISNICAMLFASDIPSLRS